MEETEVIGLENQESQNQETQETQETQGLQGDENLEGDEPKGETEKKDLPKGFDRRLKALTRQKYQLQQELEQIKQTLSQPKQNLNRDDYTEAEWIKIQVSQAIAQEKEALRQEEEASRQAQKAQEAVQAQINEYSSILPDFAEVLEEANSISVPNSAIEFIRDSEIATLLTYHIAKSEEIQDKLLELSKGDANGRRVERYLSKIEAQLEAEMASRKAPKKSGTSAPAPIGNPKPQAGNGAIKTIDPTKMSSSEYRKWKAQGGLKNLR